MEKLVEYFRLVQEDPNKNNYVLIKFDIAEFYPSVSESILQTAIRFAKDHIKIKDEEKGIIYHCRKSFLF